MPTAPVLDGETRSLVELSRTTLTYGEKHLTAFSAFSHDANPLHRSEDYARRTPFGERVVFGVSSVLSILGHWAQGRSFRLRSLEAQFRKPLFLGRGYRLELRRESGSVTALLSAGDVLQTRVVFTADYATVADPETGRGENFIPLQSAREIQLSAIEPSRWFTVSCEGYIPDRRRLAQDLPLFGLAEGQMPFHQMSALLWSSYTVGMQIPGRQALFSELTFRFQKDSDCEIDGFKPSHCEGRFDPRFNRIKLKGRGNGVEAFMITAFCRPPPLEYALSEVKRAFKLDLAYQGKSAFISGASRGFGAVLASGLALKGAHVTVNYLHSKDEAEMVMQTMHRSGAKMRLARGDVGRREDCERMAEQIAQEQVKLDVLVHNAFPAIRALGFLEQSPEVFLRFVNQAIAAVSMLSYAFLPIMSEGGTVVVISSGYVTNPQPLFSHYGAAKSAIEGMVRVLSLEHPALRFVIARLPRMLTDQTNTPFQTEKVSSAADVGAALMERLASISDPGVWEVNL